MKNIWRHDCWYSQKSKVIREKNKNPTKEGENCTGITHLKFFTGISTIVNARVKYLGHQ